MCFSREGKNNETLPVSSGREHVYRYWSTAEIRYLRQHRLEGADAIAAALSRTPASVRIAAHRHKISLFKVAPGDLCPRCAARTVTAGTAAARQGLCIVCYEREKAALRRQAAAEEAAHREYEQAKKEAQRRRK